MTLALDFSQNVDAVVVAESPAHLVVVHGEVIFLYAPEPRETGRVDDLEDPGLPALPRDVVCVSLRGVVQQLLQEVPEQSAIWKNKEKKKKKLKSQKNNSNFTQSRKSNLNAARKQAPV